MACRARTGWPRRAVREYTEGTLLIDIVDGGRNELVWRGVGVGEVRANSPEKITQRINEAVTEILKNFAPSQ